jgi:hypothetical protein
VTNPDPATAIALEELAAWAEYQGRRGNLDDPGRARWVAAVAALTADPDALERWRAAVYAARHQPPAP